MPIVKIKSGSHYYSPDGAPQYDAGMREAKKQGLYPSITTIQRIINKEGLTAWKLEQMLLSALTTPRDGLDEDDFLKKIIEDSEAEGAAAAEFGSAMHSHIENYLVYGQQNIDDERERKSFEAVKKSFLDIYCLDTEIAEKSFASKFGFGGRIDWMGRDKEGNLILVDWKSQRIKWKEFKRPTDNEHEISLESGLFSRPVPTFYPEWLMQLAGGMILIEENTDLKIDRFMSVVFNSDKLYPDVVVYKEYTAEENIWGARTITALLKFWRLYNKFD